MTEAAEERTRMQGVFSATVTARIGAGATRRKVDRQVFFFAIEQEDGQMAVQALNANHLPSGDMKYIAKDVLSEKYAPEPEVYATKTVPALKELAKTIAKAEGYAKRGEPFSAEMEFQKALKMDSKNVRALFGLGLSYLDRGETEKADDVYQQLVKNSQAFTRDNKHQFNEFGIKLRKSGMYDQALKYYASAYMQAKDDENLVFNMARTYYDKGDLERAAASLKKAVELKPDFVEAQKFLKSVTRKIEDKKKGYVPPQLRGKK